MAKRIVEPLTPEARGNWVLKLCKALAEDTRKRKKREKEAS